MTISKSEWLDILKTTNFDTSLNDLDDADEDKEVDYYIDMAELPASYPDRIFECPDDAENTLKAAIAEYHGYRKADNIYVVFRNFNELLRARKIKINKLRAKSINKLIVFDGLVRQASDVMPRIKKTWYIHNDTNCGGLTSMVQTKDEEEFPETCDSCGRPCNRNNLRPQDEMFENEDYQVVQVEEEPEGLKGRQPERIECHMHGPFTKDGIRVGIGDRVSILGIYRTRRKKDKTPQEKFIQVIGVETKGKNYEDLILTPEEEAKFDEMAKNPNLLEDLSQSFAPNIEGGEVEKKAVTLQLFGGNFFPTEKRRGNIHILLIGEPSTFKTKLSNYVVEIAPHCVRATGGPTTAAGLTSTAAKDETTGRWTLEAGAAVLADMGMLIIDEFDKMDDKTKGSLHEVLEDGTATANKAGITAILMARCSVLAIMNPKHNRFDAQYSIASQINLLPSMLSRFDLIFALKDTVNEKKDRKIAAAMFRARSGERPEVKYSQDDITKYIIYARSKIHEIKVTSEAEKLITDKFIQLRNVNAGKGIEDVIPITFRQLEGMSRLAEAHAKMRLSNVATVEDAKVAIEIVEYYLKTMCTDTEGNMSIDVTVGEKNVVEKNLKKRLTMELQKAFNENGKDERYTIEEICEMVKNPDRFRVTQLLNELADKSAISFKGNNDIKIFSTITDVR